MPDCKCGGKYFDCDGICGECGVYVGDTRFKEFIAGEERMASRTTLREVMRKRYCPTTVEEVAYAMDRAIASGIRWRSGYAVKPLSRWEKLRYRWQRWYNGVRRYWGHVWTALRGNECDEY